MSIKMNEKEMIMLFISDDINLADVDKFIKNNGIDSIDRDGRSLIFSAIVEKKKELTTYLLKKGCLINLQDKQGFSPLHFAVIHDNPDVAKLLIENGANLDVKDQWGNTPLLRAAMTKLSHKDELIKLLVDSGANPQEPNNTGVTAENLLMNK